MANCIRSRLTILAKYFELINKYRDSGPHESRNNSLHQTVALTVGSNLTKAVKLSQTSATLKNPESLPEAPANPDPATPANPVNPEASTESENVNAVSYTHLTLPTKRIV